MAIHFTTGAQPETRVSTGGEAQTTPADLRLGLRLSEFRSGLRHLIASAVASLTSTLAAVGLIVVTINQDSIIALLLAGMMAAGAFWMVNYCRATGGILLEKYHDALCNYDKATKTNTRLLRRNCWLEQTLAAAGEADGDAGGKHPSPSASNIRRFIPHKERVQ